MVCKGNGCFTTMPQWFLKNKLIQNVENMDILGVTFNNNVRYDDYVSTRIQKAKRSMFSISNIGMSYPGLNTKSKVHLYKTICLPTLIYGMDCLSLSVNNVAKIQSAQGNIMKYVCGLSKRSHHSSFLQALGVVDANTLINDYNKSVFTRIFQNDSPTRNLCVYFIDLFITHNILIPGTLVNRIVDMGISPTSLIFSCCNSSKALYTADGLVDSLRCMLYNDNYIKPWSNEYLIVKLLTKSL